MCFLTNGCCNLAAAAEQFWNNRVFVCGLTAQLRSHFPDHRQGWFGQSDLNPSSMCPRCIILCYCNPIGQNTLMLGVKCLNYMQRFVGHYDLSVPLLCDSLHYFGLFVTHWVSYMLRLKHYTVTI